MLTLSPSGLFRPKHSERAGLSRRNANYERFLIFASLRVPIGQPGHRWSGEASGGLGRLIRPSTSLACSGGSRTPYSRCEPLELGRPVFASAQWFASVLQLALTATPSVRTREQFLLWVTALFLMLVFFALADQENCTGLRFFSFDCMIRYAR